MPQRRDERSLEAERQSVLMSQPGLAGAATGVAAPPSAPPQGAGLPALSMGGSAAEISSDRLLQRLANLEIARAEAQDLGTAYTLESQIEGIRQLLSQRGILHPTGSEAAVGNFLQRTMLGGQ